MATLTKKLKDLPPTPRQVLKDDFIPKNLPPVKPTPWWSTALQYVVVIGVIAGVWFGWGRFHLHRPAAVLTGPQAILFALALAFIWTQVWKLGTTKPFSCMKCMTGWFAMVLAWTFHVELWYLYLPLGVFVGGLFEAIKMRWL